MLRSSAHFSILFSSLFSLSFMSYLYILEIKFLLVASFANIFSHSFHFVYGLLYCAKACKFD